MQTRLLSTFVRAAAFAAVFLIPAAAHAQGIGVRAGVSGDPQQFYFGGHAEIGPVAAPRLWFRPNLEIGVGNDVTLTTANLEFTYRLPVSSDPWRVHAGGGPALVVTRVADVNSTGPGLNVLAGIEHRDGFFAEFKLGFIDSPTVKFGVGYTWGRR